MAKVTFTLTDKGGRTVNAVTDVDTSMDGDSAGLTPAAVCALAISTMLENGMLSVAGGVALQAIEAGERPSEAVLAYFGGANDPT